MRFSPQLVSCQVQGEDVERCRRRRVDNALSSVQNEVRFDVC